MKNQNFLNFVIANEEIYNSLTLKEQELISDLDVYYNDLPAYKAVACQESIFLGKYNYYYLIGYKDNVAYLLYKLFDNVFCVCIEDKTGDINCGVK